MRTLRKLAAGYLLAHLLLLGALTVYTRLRGGTITVERKGADLWIGLFWKHGPASLYADGTLHVWVCTVPALPVHFVCPGILHTLPTPMILMAEDWAFGRVRV